MKHIKYILSISLLLVIVLSGCSQVKTPPTANYSATNQYMQIALEEAREGIYNGNGGPFGSVVVKDGKVVGKGHNVVLSNNDSTAHGEISAIRDAEKNLNTYNLDGCVIYTTGEPCPMCLAACMWANIKKIYYGCTINDNDKIGFRDEEFNNKLKIYRDSLGDYLEEIDRDACLKLFDEYNSIERTIY